MIRELCSALDMGLAPVREALNRLASEGMVAQRARRGCRVVSFSLTDLDDLVRTKQWLNELGVRQSIIHGDTVWEERVILAFHRLARTPSYTTSEAMEAHRNPAWNRMHFEFHASLIAACRSNWLKDFCRTLFIASDRYRALARLKSDPKKRLKEHRKIMDSVVARARRHRQANQLARCRGRALIHHRIRSHHRPSRHGACGVRPRPRRILRQRAFVAPHGTGDRRVSLRCGDRRVQVRSWNAYRHLSMAIATDILGTVSANIGIGLETALSHVNLWYCFLGVLLGTIVGVLPGIRPLAAISLVFPITLYLEPASALIMLAGIWYGTAFGGSTAAILIIVPGTASSAVTTIDSYPMAQQERAGVALFLTAIASFVGGTIGIVLMMLSAPIIVVYALKFGSAEYLSLMMLGLVAASTISASTPQRVSP